jgi:hypothetical protein
MAQEKLIYFFLSYLLWLNSVSGMHGLTFSSLVITVLSELHSTELLKSLQLQRSTRKYRSNNKVWITSLNIDGHEFHQYLQNKRKLKQWWSWIPPISTKRTIFSDHNWTHWAQKRPRRTTLEINMSENRTDVMGI